MADSFARLLAYQEFKKAEGLQFEVFEEIEEWNEIQLDELENEPIEDDHVGVPNEIDEVNLR